MAGSSPQAYVLVHRHDRQPHAALWLVAISMVTALILTSAVYTRPGGLLHAIEPTGRPPRPLPPMASNDRPDFRTLHAAARTRHPKDGKMTHLFDKLNFFQTKELGENLGRLGPDHPR